MTDIHIQVLFSFSVRLLLHGNLEKKTVALFFSKKYINRNSK